jgi:hypothetical protein
MTRRAAAWVGVGITILIAASSGVAIGADRMFEIRTADAPAVPTTIPCRSAGVWRFQSTTTTSCWSSVDISPPRPDLA